MGRFFYALKNPHYNAIFLALKLYLNRISKSTLKIALQKRVKRPETRFKAPKSFSSLQNHFQTVFLCYNRLGGVFYEKNCRRDEWRR